MSSFEPQIEIIPELSHSALVKTKYSCDNLDVPWHKHLEVEIIFIVEGFGSAVVGDKVFSYEPGDLFVFGSEVPHMFRSETNEVVKQNTHIVIQFNPKLLNDEILGFCEMTKISKLHQKLCFGLKFCTKQEREIVDKLENIVNQTQFEAILDLFNLLNILGNRNSVETLSSIPYDLKYKENSRIGKIFHYVLTNFEQNISVNDAAKLVNLSKPAFCNYFKKKVNKRFSEFVNELRVNKACILLRETELTISEICYNTGFSNLSYFNRYFLKLKGVSPIKYRKSLV